MNLGDSDVKNRQNCAQNIRARVFGKRPPHRYNESRKGKEKLKVKKEESKPLNQCS